jgi:hypothetical protein
VQAETTQQPVIAAHLRNGQTVIARYKGENETHLGLDKPYILETFPGAGPGGQTGVMLTPYLGHHKVFAPLEEFAMPHDMVLMLRPCPEELTATYVSKASGIEVAKSRIVGA